MGREDDFGAGFLRLGRPAISLELDWALGRNLRQTLESLTDLTGETWEEISKMQHSTRGHYLPSPLYQAQCSLGGILRRHRKPR